MLAVRPRIFGLIRITSSVLPRLLFLKVNSFPMPGMSLKKGIRPFLFWVCSFISPAIASVSPDFTLTPCMITSLVEIGVTKAPKLPTAFSA